MTNSHKDSPQIQKDRMRQLVSEQFPDLEIEFYPNQVHPATTDIRFRLRDIATGKIVGVIEKDYELESSKVADKSDLELCQLIRALINKN